ncbi:MAG: RNA methyltransferase [Candidatus Amulumruptor caecigallinarius]|nr:RNA methyltransferase [Candidatus Amulumruptor caecigallinarius]
MEELSKNKQNLFASLSQVKMRRKHGLFIVEGKKGVIDSLNSFEAVAVVVASPDDTDVEYMRRMAPDADFFRASVAQMKKISDFSTPSGILAVFRIPDAANSLADVDENKLYVVLDGVRDPGNLGTIIRTCHWFGIFRIFASHDTVDIYNPKTVQSTMGSIGKVRVDYCDLKELFETHPDMPVYGTLLNGENIFKKQLSSAGFIVMGNEGKGISPRLREYVTRPLLIPPACDDHAESLNVAVATAIVVAKFKAG